MLLGLGTQQSPPVPSAAVEKGKAVPPLNPMEIANSHPSPPITVPPPPHLFPPPPVSAAEMMAMATLQSSWAALTSAPMLSMPTLPAPPTLMPGFDNSRLPNGVVNDAGVNGMAGDMSNGVVKDGSYHMCVHCGQACKDHSELAAHDAVCPSHRGAKMEPSSPMGCDRLVVFIRHQKVYIN